MLLQRNLIYTAVTRGKKLVVLVGAKKALAIGIKNDKTRKRYTNFWRRLAG
jgi:exodeoxyribonuclease V alpha subunit